MGPTIITLTGRLPEKGVLVGLAVYEYITLGRELSDVAMEILAELSRAQRKFEFCKFKEVEFWIIIARYCTKS